LLPPPSFITAIVIGAESCYPCDDDVTIFAFRAAYSEATYTTSIALVAGQGYRNLFSPGKLLPLALIVRPGG
jgi:hypothetical protein